MRRSFGAMTAAMLLAIVLPSTAAGAAPIRETAQQTSLMCDVDTSAGAVGIFAEAGNGGVFASMVIWAPGTDPETDLPTAISADALSRFVDPALTVTFDLYEATDPNDPEAPPWGDPVGTATLDAELLPSGSVIDFGSREIRDGNRRILLEQTLQPRSVSGTLSLDLLDGTQETVALSTTDECGGFTFAQSVFVTNPNAYVLAIDQIYLECAWETAAGQFGLFAVGDGTGYSTSHLFAVAGDRVAIGITTSEFSETSFAAVHDLVDIATGDPVGTAVTAASVAPTGERITEHEWVDPNRFVVVGEQLSVDGTISIPLEGASVVLPVNDVHCNADVVTIRLQEKIGRR